MFYGDAAKAFDSVDQPKFMRKLLKYPIGNQTLLIHFWMKTIRSNWLRKIATIWWTLSNKICGPFLYLPFFNDSDKDCSPARVFNFADDKKIAYIIKNDSDSRILQKSIVNFSWSSLKTLQLVVKMVMFYHHTSIAAMIGMWQHLWDAKLMRMCYSLKQW